MYRSISLLEWYKIELARLSALLDEINYTSDEESKNKTDKDDLKNILLNFFKNSFEKDEKTSNDQIIADLNRTKFDPSLNFYHYCRKWLNRHNHDYAQGMLDGGLPFLAISYFYLSNDNLHGYLPFDLIRFAYEDDNGLMSTFLLYVEPSTKSWCIAVCRDPFQEILNLRFDIMHSSEDWDDVTLHEIVCNQKISMNILNFIHDKLSPDSKFDKKALQTNARCFLNLSHGTDFFNSISYLSSVEISEKLWGKQAFFPSQLSEKTSDARAAEIERDFERLLVHPSLLPSCQDILSNWQQADIPYIQGLMSGLFLTKRSEANEERFDIKLNFIYHTQDGQYASFYFYYDLLNQKCFLAFCDDLMQAYRHQNFTCVFPLEKMPSQKILAQIIDHDEIANATFKLIALLPRMKALAKTDKEQLKSKITALQDDFKYRFGLQSYSNETSSYHAVEQPIDSADDILPKPGFFVWLGQLLASFFIALIKGIVNLFSDVFCCNKEQYSTLTM